MADTNTNAVLSVICTVGSKLPDCAIKNGQLIFVRDKQMIALDFNDKRTFYNQIVVLSTEQERQGLLAPVSGLFYFVVDTAVLWRYETDWVQITTPPSEIIYIGTSLPELGKANTLYVDKENKNISVWDNDIGSYVVVANKTGSITDEFILNLFK